MALKENDVNWFRPLWRRVGVVALLAVWLAWEVLFTKDQVWMLLVGAALAYAFYTYIIVFPKETKSNEPLPSPSQAPEQDRQDP